MRRGTRISSLALLVTIGVLATGLVGGPATALPLPFPGAGAQVVPPQDDPFYTPPNPIPDVPAGTVLRSRPVDVSSNGYGFATPVDARQILYRSTSAKHQPNAVSGTVLVPKKAWPNGPRPLVSYAVGTHGLGPTCAPSYKMATGTENEYNLFNQALAKGWAVVVTDYEGLGTPGPHTYVAGRSLGHAMLDAARAAQTLPGAGLSPSAPVGLWGYSEGGFATGWAAELASTYAPDVNVIGAAVGAAPADLEAMARLHDGGFASGLVLAAAVGLAKAYPETPFHDILTEEGKRAAADIATQCVGEFAAKYSFRRLDSFTTVPDPMSLPAWQTVLADVRLGSVAPASPVMVYHAPADELVLFTQGVQLQSEWCAGGATVRFEPVILGEHVMGAVAGAPLAVDYLGGRFAGKAAQNTCTAQP